MKTKIVLTCLALSATTAWAAPNNFNFDGVLLDGTQQPITSGTLKFQIYDPTGSCLLYEETQSPTIDAAGNFSVQVGSGSPTGNSPGIAWATIFQSIGQVRTTGTNCSSGYTAATGDGRALRVWVNSTQLTPDFPIASVPMATAAQTLAAFSTIPGDLTLANSGALLMNSGGPNVGFKAPASVAATEILTMPQNLPSTSGQVLTGDTNGVLSWTTPGAAAVNSSSLDTGFGTTPGGLLMRSSGAWQSLTPGSPGTVLTMSGSNPAWLSPSLPTLSSGMIWVGNGGIATPTNMGGDATLNSAGLLNLNFTGVSAGTYSKVTVNPKGQVTAGSILTANDIPFAFVNGGNSGLGPVTIGTQDNFPVNIMSSFTTAMTITASSGYAQVGIGLSDPSAALQVVSPQSTAFEVDSTDSFGTVATIYNNPANAAFELISSGPSNPNGQGNFYLYDATNGLTRLLVTSAGNIGIGTTTPTAGLDVQSPSGFQVGSTITAGAPVQNMRICSGTPATSGTSQSFTCTGVAPGMVASCSYTGSLGGTFTWSSTVGSANTISLTFSGTAGIATWKCLVVN